VQRIRCEGPRPKECRLQTGGREEPLDLGVERRHRIRLWEERVWSPVRCGEEDDPPRAAGKTFDNRLSSLRRGGPDQEDDTDTAQPRVQRSGHDEIAGHHVDVRRPGRRLGRRVRARTGTPASTRRSTTAPDPAGRSGDEHWRHVRPRQEDLDSVGGRRTESSMPPQASTTASQRQRNSRSRACDPPRRAMGRPSLRNRHRAR
jgi:hypothetical protein